MHEWYDGRSDSNPGSRPIDADSQFHLASIRKTISDSPSASPSRKG